MFSFNRYVSKTRYIYIQKVNYYSTGDYTMFTTNNVITLLNLISKKLKLNDFLSSVLVFGGVPLAAGFIMTLPQNNTYVLFEFEILLALAAMAIAPFLIKFGPNAAERFHLEMVITFPSQKTRIESVYQNVIEKALYSKKHLIFGLPIAVVISYLLLICYEATSNLTKIWLVITFSTLFLLSGIGFWAIILLMKMSLNMMSIPLHIDAYHPDNIGGLSTLSSFCILISMAFSSGSLLFPLLFRILGVVSVKGGILIYLLVGPTLLYTLLIILSFVIPAIAITKLLQNGRNKLLTEVAQKIHKIKSDYFKSGDYKNGVNFFILNEDYKRISLVKTNPYNFKISLELIGAALFPIVTVIIQYYLKLI